MTTGEVVVRRLDGVEQILAIYPYVVEGGFTVAAKTPATGLYDAHFGMVLTNEPHVCTGGYEGTDTRTPQDGSNRPMNMGARCTEPATQSNARGAQHAPPRAPAAVRRRAGRGGVRPGDRRADLGRGPTARRGTDDDAAPRTYGADSWRWLSSSLAPS